MVQYAQRKEIQLCYPFSEERLLNKGQLRSQWHLPALLDYKLNGERCRAVVSNGRCLLFSSTAELITTVPHINQAMLSFPPGEYDGELYVHGWTFSEIHSVISTVMSIHPKSSEMQFHLFDAISKLPQIDRIVHLNSLYAKFGTSPSILRTPCVMVRSLDEVMFEYDRAISLGYEGFVLKDFNGLYVRRRSPYWMKFKPKKTDIYSILAFNEAISIDGHPKSMLGSFTCIDSEGSTFDVGAGKLSHKEREYLWAEGLISGSRLKIEYQTLSDSKGVPHFSRAVEVIYP